MNKFLTAVKDGTIKGLKTGGMLLKIMLPIYILVVILKYSPVMPFLEDLAAPTMRVFNMPADAVVPIITGAFTDEYATVAAIGGFSFSTATVTTIAMIVLCFHSIPVETAVAQKIGFPAWRIMLFRLFLAIAVGVLTGILGRIFL